MNLTINIKNKVKGQFVEAFLVFENINSVLSSSRDKTYNYQFFNNVPVGLQVCLVVLSIKDDVPYTAIQKITLGEGGETKLGIMLEETTVSAFAEHIEALN